MRGFRCATPDEETEILTAAKTASETVRAEIGELPVAATIPADTTISPAIEECFYCGGTGPCECYCN